MLLWLPDSGNKHLFLKSKWRLASIDSLCRVAPNWESQCIWIVNGNKSLTTVKLSTIVAAMQMLLSRQEQGGCHCGLLTGYFFWYGTSSTLYGTSSKLSQESQLVALCRADAIELLIFTSN